MGSQFLAGNVQGFMQAPGFFTGLFEHEQPGGMEFFLLVQGFGQLLPACFGMLQRRFQAAALTLGLQQPFLECGWTLASSWRVRSATCSSRFSLLRVRCVRARPARTAWHARPSSRS